ncbi:hypothetical protein EFR01_20330 [Sinorhizobium fredii]|nr:hypothetical protein EFR01_20330 [Sinorhizobium fredii]GLS12228.1 hypothetical protein GCM10007864_58600 [Sinorhizobium fredii]
MPGQEGQELPRVPLIGLDRLSGQAAFFGKARKPPLTLVHHLGVAYHKKFVHCRSGDRSQLFSSAEHVAEPLCFR